MTDTTLRTARLEIRPATLDDADTVYDLRTIPSVSRWIPFSDAMSREAFRDLFAQRVPFLWVIELDGSPIGEVILRVESPFAQFEKVEEAHDTEAEIGWLIHPDHQRRGYALEAVTRLIEHCFDERGLRRVRAEAFAGNEATAALAPKLGMRLEATHVKAGLHRTEGWVDLVTYALLAEEWAARS